jgi:hypothetical protein
MKEGYQQLDELRAEFKSLQGSQNLVR